jgi:hypothetical protein
MQNIVVANRAAVRVGRMQKAPLRKGDDPVALL